MMNSAGKTILLVEDEVILAMTEKMALERYGYKVITAVSGEKALSLLDEETPVDLILMDINLGKGMDGTETASRILGKKDIPLIFLSSHTEPDVVEKTEGITSYGYVVKNSSMTVLDASIKMAFKLYLSMRNEREREAALRATEAQYRNIFDNAVEGIFRSTADGRFLVMNSALAKILGYDSPEEARSAITDIRTQLWVHPEARAAVFAHLSESVKIPFAYEAEFRRKDGSVFWASVNARTVLDETGAVSFFEGFILDVTERKRAEISLSETQTLRDAIVDSTADLIWSVDPVSFGLQTFNRSLFDYFAAFRKEPIKAGDTPADLLPTAEYAALWDEMYIRALRDGPFMVEYLVSQGTRTLELNFNILKRNGAVFGISVFGKDITERKR